MSEEWTTNDLPYGCWRTTKGEIAWPSDKMGAPMPTRPDDSAPPIPSAFTIPAETVAKWRDGPWSASLFQIPEELVQIVVDARLTQAPATALGTPACMSLPSDDLAIPPLPFNALRWSR